MQEGENFLDELGNFFGVEAVSDSGGLVAPDKIGTVDVAFDLDAAIASERGGLFVTGVERRRLGEVFFLAEGRNPPSS